MDDQNWLKYGAIGLVAIGFFAILWFALNRVDGLEGTSWSVETLALDGVSVTPIDGTELTAIFDDAAVAGTAGCNGFNASYETDGDLLSVGPAASTLKFCDQPAGIMDQEVAYLTLLQSADRFDIDGGVLTMYAEDSQVLSFVGPNTD
ncbi:MAG: META domain-containing protein [Actinomycetia bacterium]|nr:META domain-containing protein [Actinomycetes bacterium]